MDSGRAKTDRGCSPGGNPSTGRCARRRRSHVEETPQRAVHELLKSQQWDCIGIAQATVVRRNKRSVSWIQHGLCTQSRKKYLRVTVEIFWSMDSCRLSVLETLVLIPLNSNTDSGRLQYLKIVTCSRTGTPIYTTKKSLYLMLSPNNDYGSV
jgi:hypothetical protein